MNATIGLFRIATHQMFGGRRLLMLLVGLGALLGLGLLARWGMLQTGANYEGRTPYGGMLMLTIIGVIAPIGGVFVGVTSFYEEITGKTLVYLWTRPVSRWRVVLVKFLSKLFWFLLVLAAAVVAVYTLFYSLNGWDRAWADRRMIVWDLRAILLGGTAYAALGLALAALVKKPLLAGIVYVMLIDSIAFFLPGWTKALSVRHNIVVLCTQTKEGMPRGFLKFLSDSGLTEGTALLSLLTAITVLVAAALFLVSQKEFLPEEGQRQ